MCFIDYLKGRTLQKSCFGEILVQFSTKVVEMQFGEIWRNKRANLEFLQSKKRPIQQMCQANNTKSTHLHAPRYRGALVQFVTAPWSKPVLILKLNFYFIINNTFDLVEIGYMPQPCLKEEARVLLLLHFTLRLLGVLNISLSRREM